LVKRFSIIITNGKNRQTTVENSLPHAKHQNLTFENFALVNGNNLKYKNVYSNYWSTLKHLILRHCYADTLDYANFLTVFSNLQHITIDNSDILFDDRPPPTTVTWNNLKSIKIQKSYLGMLKQFTNSKLTKLEMIQTRYQDNFDMKIYLDEFFDAQADSLKVLKCRKSQIPDEKLVNILKKSNLTKVEIETKRVAKVPEVMTETSKNCNWKKLTIYGLSNKVETVKKILLLHPSIDELRFTLCSFKDKDEVIPQITSFLPHITFLRLPMNYGCIPFNISSITFNKLLTLEVEAVKYQLHVNKLMQLLKMSPNLKALKIFWIGNHAKCDLFNNLFKNINNLEELHLGSPTDTFELTSDLIEIIKEESEGLKIRKLSTFSDDVEMTRERIKILQTSRNINCVVLEREYENVERIEVPSSSRLDRDKINKVIPTCSWSE
jgi:hypothetical protein